VNPGPVREGEVLAGKYRIDRVLGAGGMGVVVAATHITLGERVALKFLLHEAALHGDSVSRFLREARAAARIKSEHIARVFDVGTLDSGAPYYVMEYLDGSDLGARLVEHGPLAVQQAVDYLLQACEAVAQAHALGIVHRDLKPTNLFVVKGADGSDVVKVLDFGISKVADASSAGGDALTRTSVSMGSPLYMSPEQMTSARDVDGRSDIWALGVVLYELVSGTTPFPGETLPQVCAAVLNGATPSLRARRPELPAELDRVIGTCLGKQPHQRYADVADLAAALAPLAPGYSLPLVERVARIAGKRDRLPSRASVPETPPAVAIDQQAASAIARSADGGSTQEPWSQTHPRPAAAPRRGAEKVWFAAAALGVLGMVGALGWFVGQRRHEPAQAAAASAESRSAAAAPAPPTPLVAPPAASPAEPVASAAAPAPRPQLSSSETPLPSKPRPPRSDPRGAPAKPSRAPETGSPSGGREYDPRDHL
jgi:eukaryotic-like serine/threonine-protein kinase